MKKSNQTELYKKWLLQDHWQAADAACLLTQKDPNELVFRYMGCASIKNGYEKTEMLFNAIRTWFSINDGYGGMCCKASPFFYIERALNNGINPPKELLKILIAKLEKYYKCSLIDPSKYPALKEIAEKESDAIKITLTDQNNKKKDELMEKILNESASSRDERVKARGFELYAKCRKDKGNEKLVKTDIARMIFDEEEPIYKKAIKKQPALATYVKAIRTP
jgi:hypothetical protein